MYTLILQYRYIHIYKRRVSSQQWMISQRYFKLVLDLEADGLLAYASSAICVEHPDDSLNSAIHTAYRALLRPSSLCKPRYPLLEV